MWFSDGVGVTHNLISLSNITDYSSVAVRLWHPLSNLIFRIGEPMIYGTTLSKIKSFTTSIHAALDGFFGAIYL
ncbi:hypothetical protein CAJAP_09460 [Camponotus japonicus]